MVYQPRPKEELDRIAALVRSAIGFDAKRGDQLEVVNLRFADTPPLPVGEPAGWMGYFQFTKDDIMRAAEMGVMALLGLIVLLMVVRPLVRRIVTPEVPAAAGQAAAAAGGRRGRRARPRRQSRSPAAASPTPAAPTSPSSAATNPSPSPTAPRP